ncbi:hypothetical protein KJS94_17650 [Flavihumibacter rivuli]|uniref:nitrilase-related carbon-nitrogen hydrolase n=1 Tax=Flavihumibacter rivuli TaxID=2838156 RepID=UPI001BDE5E6E|nr:nitrilase-related carbon-nitrogen hydrolase [Flavihumibacter rivuli]ULQ56478.1 hypothetical protein KJS94_17650 [Flavihumibacter rivuli]
MKKTIIRLLVAVTILGGIYWLWSISGRADETIGNTEPQKTTELSAINPLPDTIRGNLLGIQPYLTPIDYSSKARLGWILEEQLSQAREKGWINNNTIAVYPEYIGTWLVAAGEKTSIYEAPDMQSAMTTLVLSNLPRFIRHYASAPKGTDKTKHALFSMKSARMAEQYQQVFSNLAKQFNVTIVAGSIVLEEPYIDKSGNLRTGKGSLYNTTAVFSPEGSIMPPLVKKAFPINDEKPFTACGKPGDMPVFLTKAGNMGVLICADSWYPEAYTGLANKAEFLAVPSLASTDSIWKGPWMGYNGAAAPVDVDTTRYRKITEEDAWASYSMGGRGPKAGIHQGINVFFTGDMWDMHPEGRVLSLIGDSLNISAPALKTSKVYNLWLKN